MSCTIFVNLPGWCTNHGSIHTSPVHTFRKLYKYNLYITTMEPTYLVKVYKNSVIIKFKVHLNNHAYTKINHF